MKLSLNAIEKMSFAEKKQFVYNMFLMHKKILVLRNSELLNKNLKKNVKSPEFKSTFELIVEQLDPKFSWIIEQEFTSKNHNWVEEYYSKSTYYKYFHKALDEFLYFIYG